MHHGPQSTALGPGGAAARFRIALIHPARSRPNKWPSKHVLNALRFDPGGAIVSETPRPGGSGQLSGSITRQVVDGNEEDETRQRRETS